MKTQTTYSKQAAGIWQSFGKVKNNIVVKYEWWEIKYDGQPEEHEWKYRVRQTVYKRVFNNPERKWEPVSEKSRRTDHIGKFTKRLKEYGFSGAWPTWDAKPIMCAVTY